jgi:hypothetical protein
MAVWNLVHDEEFRNDTTMTVHYADGLGLIFAVNSEGLTIQFYNSARDAVLAEHRIGEICYGEDIVLYEDGHGLYSELLDKVFAATEDKPYGCEHEGTCEERFHEAQVILGNDEEDDCKSCQKYKEEK